MKHGHLLHHRVRGRHCVLGALRHDAWRRRQERASSPGPGNDVRAERHLASVVDRHDDSHGLRNGRPAEPRFNRWVTMTQNVVRRRIRLGMWAAAICRTVRDGERTAFLVHTSSCPADRRPSIARVEELDVGRGDWRVTRGPTGQPSATCCRTFQRTSERVFARWSPASLCACEPSSICRCALFSIDERSTLDQRVHPQADSNTEPRAY